jgi:hypothetical protein
LLDETLVPIADACNQFPVPVSRGKIERLWRTGTRGVRLETILIGDRRFTSKEAIRRFLENSQGEQDTDESKVRFNPKRIETVDKEIEAARARYKFPPSGYQPRNGK